MEILGRGNVDWKACWITTLRKKGSSWVPLANCYHDASSGDKGLVRLPLKKALTKPSIGNPEKKQKRRETNLSTFLEQV